MDGLSDLVCQAGLRLRTPRDQVPEVLDREALEISVDRGPGALFDRELEILVC